MQDKTINIKLSIFFVVQLLFNANYSICSNQMVDDNDIIVAYRVMTSSLISPETFSKLKIMSTKYHWSLQDLALCIASLPESSKLCGPLFFHASKEVKKNLCNEFQTTVALFDEVSINSLNPTGTMANETDLLLGIKIFAPNAPIDKLKTMRISHKWDLFMLGVHLINCYGEAHLDFPAFNEFKAIPLTLHNGMTLYGYEADVFIGKYILENKFYEPWLEKLMRKLLKVGDYAVDIGANIGYHTAMLSDIVGIDGHVFAIEAIPGLCSLLRRSKKVNKWSNVSIFEQVLSDKPAAVYFLMKSLHPGGSSIINADDALNLKKTMPDSILQTSSTTLDDLLGKFLNRLDFIKMDVEGYEDLVLKGSVSIIEKFMPIIVAEFTPGGYRSRGKDPVAILQHYIDRGYCINVVGDLFRLPDEKLMQALVTYQSAEKIVNRIDRQGDFLDIIFYPPNRTCTIS